MPPLRVGILTYDFVPFIGGQGRVTYDLWRHLRQRDDIDVTVISPSRNALPGHHTRFAWTQRAGKHPLFSLLANAFARRWCDELKLDVLHVNGGPGGVLLVRDPGVPVICWPHHTYEQSLRLVPTSRWKSLARGVERTAYRKASMLVCTTASVEASLRDRLRVEQMIRRIPCGIDTDAFAINEEARGQEEVLCVGRLDRRKQPKLLLQAFERVASRDRSVRLVFAGRGPLEPELRAYAASRGLQERVVFEHSLGQHALVERYNRAALVVAASAFEGFGLAAVEAQSCGACVVATDSEGLRDVIIDGVTGVLARPTSDALADAIIRMMADEPARRALGMRAATHVRATYSWPHIAGQWADAYYTAAGRVAGRHSGPIAARQPGPDLRSSKTEHLLGVPR